MFAKLKINCVFQYSLDYCLGYSWQEYKFFRRHQFTIPRYSNVVQKKTNTLLSISLSYPCTPFHIIFFECTFEKNIRHSNLLIIGGKLAGKEWVFRYSAKINRLYTPNATSSMKKKLLKFFFDFQVFWTFTWEFSVEMPESRFNSIDCIRQN